MGINGKNLPNLGRFSYFEISCIQTTSSRDWLIE